MKKISFILMTLSTAIMFLNADAKTKANTKTITGFDGVKVEIQNPKRIIALNSTTFEIIYELGKASLVVGVDNGTLFFPPAESITKLGHPYRPSVEGMISLNPDLVISTEDSLPKASVEQLRAAKIPTLILQTSYADGYKGLEKRINTIAQVLGTEKQGKALIKKINKQIKDLKAKVNKIKNKKAVFFLYAHSPSDASIYGKETGSHFLIEQIGAQNAADFATGVKPLTAEAMVQASPDSIIMMQRGLDAVGNLEGALKMPGVGLTPAGQNKKIFVVDNTVRWIGPRFPQFADQLFNEVYGNN